MSEKDYTKDDIRRLLDGYTLAKKSEYSKIPPGSNIRYFTKISKDGVKPLKVKLNLGGLLLKNEDEQFMIKIFGKKTKNIFSLNYGSVYKVYYKFSASHKNKLLEEEIGRIRASYDELKKKYDDNSRRIAALERILKKRKTSEK